MLGAIIAGGGCCRDRERQRRASTLGQGFASNGYGAHSPGGYSLMAGLVCEVVMTFVFLIVILGATDEARRGRLRADRDRPGADADPPDHIPVTNTSVNPARSTGPALFVGRVRAEQLWLFWVAPIVGAFIGPHVFPAGSPGKEA